MAKIKVPKRTIKVPNKTVSAVAESTLPGLGMASQDQALPKVGWAEQQVTPKLTGPETIRPGEHPEPEWQVRERYERTNRMRDRFSAWGPYLNAVDREVSQVKTARDRPWILDKTSAGKKPPFIQWTLDPIWDGAPLPFAQLSPEIDQETTLGNFMLKLAGETFPIDSEEAFDMALFEFAGAGMPLGAMMGLVFKNIGGATLLRNVKKLGEKEFFRNMLNSRDIRHVLLEHFPGIELNDDVLHIPSDLVIKFQEYVSRFPGAPRSLWNRDIFFGETRVAGEVGVSDVDLAGGTKFYQDPNIKPHVPGGRREPPAQPNISSLHQPGEDSGRELLHNEMLPDRLNQAMFMVWLREMFPKEWRRVWKARIKDSSEPIDIDDAGRVINTETREVLRYPPEEVAEDVLSIKKQHKLFETPEETGYGTSDESRLYFESESRKHRQIRTGTRPSDRPGKDRKNRYALNNPDSYFVYRHDDKLVPKDPVSGSSAGGDSRTAENYRSIEDAESAELMAMYMNLELGIEDPWKYHLNDLANHPQLSHLNLNQYPLDPVNTKQLTGPVYEENVLVQQRLDLTSLWYEAGEWAVKRLDKAHRESDISGLARALPKPLAHRLLILGREAVYDKNDWPAITSSFVSPAAKIRALELDNAVTELGLKFPDSSIDPLERDYGHPIDALRLSYWENVGGEAFNHRGYGVYSALRELLEWAKTTGIHTEDRAVKIMDAPFNEGKTPGFYIDSSGEKRAIDSLNDIQEILTSWSNATYTPAGGKGYLSAPQMGLDFRLGPSDVDEAVELKGGTFLDQFRDEVTYGKQEPPSLSPTERLSEAIDTPGYNAGDDLDPVSNTSFNWANPDHRSWEERNPTLWEINKRSGGDRQRLSQFIEDDAKNGKPSVDVWHSYVTKADDFKEARFDRFTPKKITSTLKSMLKLGERRAFKFSDDELVNIKRYYSNDEHLFDDIEEFGEDIAGTPEAADLFEASGMLSDSPQWTAKALRKTLDYALSFRKAELESYGRTTEGNALIRSWSQGIHDLVELGDWDAHPEIRNILLPRHGPAGLRIHGEIENSITDEALDALTLPNHRMLLHTALNWATHNKSTWIDAPHAEDIANAKVIIKGMQDGQRKFDALTYERSGISGDWERVAQISFPETVRPEVQGALPIDAIDEPDFALDEDLLSLLDTTDFPLAEAIIEQLSRTSKRYYTSRGLPESDRLSKQSIDYLLDLLEDSDINIVNTTPDADISFMYAETFGNILESLNRMEISTDTAKSLINYILGN